MFPAHEGTLSTGDAKGASVELTFTSREILWFSRLSADGGRAAVLLDGEEIGEVDLYSADTVWGVCVFRRSVTPGGHAIRVVVRGAHSLRSHGDVVAIDGFRVLPV